MSKHHFICIFISVTVCHWLGLGSCYIRSSVNEITAQLSSAPQTQTQVNKFSDSHLRLVCQPAVTQDCVRPSVKNSINLSVGRKKEKGKKKKNEAESNKS